MNSTILQSEQQRKIWLYFVDPRSRYALVVLFLGLVLVEVTVGKVLLLFSLAWLGGALALDRARPSDQELEDLFSRDAQSLVEKAMQNLDPRDDEMRAAPLVLRGPIELAAPAFYRFFTRPRTGKDGGRRSPINRVMVLLPLEDHLGIYSCYRDSLNDQTSQVSVEEHHYKDVVSVTLEKDVEIADGQATKNGGPPANQIFSLELSNGKRLSIPVAIGQPGQEGEGLQRTGLDKTVRAIQTLLRDKR
jgi:hypothetical protein